MGFHCVFFSYRRMFPGPSLKPFGFLFFDVIALRDAPRNVSGFNTSSTSIFLTWLPIPHSPSVLCYKVNVTGYPSDALFSQVNATGLQHHIQGLDKYTQYAFTVYGVNTVGDGPSSQPAIISTDMDGKYRYVTSSLC